MEHSLNETDRQMVRRENGRSRRGGSRWLPKFPRTSAEFPSSAAATHVPASVISQCQVGSENPPSTAFTMSVCAFYHATGCHHPQISFREPFFQETRAYPRLGKEKHNAPTRPPLPFKVNAGPQSNVVSCLPAPQPRLEIIWVQG